MAEGGSDPIGDPLQPPADGYDLAERPRHPPAAAPLLAAVEPAPAPPEAPPPLSSWAFHASVYLFPFRWGVVSRWLLISAGLIPPLAIVAVFFDLNPEQPGNWIGLAVLGLPLLILLLWTLTYASVIFLRILEATAAGADRIDEWPDPDWSDWMGQFVHVTYAFAVAVAVSRAIGWYLWQGIEGLGRWCSPALAAWFGERDLWTAASLATTGAAFYLVLPIVLLSTQQAAYRWLPLTREIIRSANFRETQRSWLRFYAAAIPLVIVPAGQIRFAPRVSLISAAPGLGLMLAAALLIYARLLGRLAWEIEQRLPPVPEEEEQEQDEEPGVAEQDVELDEIPSSDGASAVPGEAGPEISGATDKPADGA